MSLHVAHCPTVKISAPDECGIPWAEKESTTQGAGRSLGPISARDTHVTLGTSLCLLDPGSFRVFVWGGRLGIFGGCPEHEAFLTLLQMSTFSDEPTDSGWESHACQSLVAARKFSSYSKSNLRTP